MAVYNRSVQDIKNDILYKSGEVVDGTSVYETSGKVLQYINDAWIAIMEGGNEFIPDMSKPWPWAVEADPITLVLEPARTTDSVTLTNGSTTGAFLVAPTVSLAGWWMNVSGRPEWFKIKTHVASTTAFTIDAPYSDDGVVGSASTIAKLEYTLSPTNGIVRLVSPMIVYRPQNQQGDQEGKIYQDDISPMLREYPMLLIEKGTPTRFAITRKTSEGVFTVRFNEYPDVQTKVEIYYIKRPSAFNDSASSFPAIPVGFRRLLEYMGAYWLCLDKNDDRAQQYLALAQSTATALIRATEKEKIQGGKNRGRLIPRRDNFVRGRKYIVQESS